MGAAVADGGYGSTQFFSLLSWQHFGKENGCCLYDIKRGIDPSQVQQGAVGNCWFLSALAVVAEKPYLIHQLLPHTQINERGCYQINLCLDGKWKPVIVDSNLPVVVKETKGPRNNSLIGDERASVINTKLKGREGVVFDLCQQDLFAYPAFCATPDLQIWPSLIEKAYAKVHGSYAQLSGGFISEGFIDLTGAPFETIVFSGNLLDREELWARLLSFHEAGFIMGVATAKGGDGLVGGHAYSVLDVVEVPDKIVGEQLKVTDFFANPTLKKQKTGLSPEMEKRIEVMGTRTNVRLVRIRNPWGKREWKGAWSANSEQWTTALRKILGSSSYAKGDGTFFMSFDDMLERFHHMDVGKTREGWVHTSTDAFFVSQKDPMQVSDSAFRIVPSRRTFAYISLIQPKKRANTGSRFWYIDPSFIVLRRPRGSNGPHSWVCEASAIVGVQRISSCEVFLDTDHEYCCVPFSCMPSSKSKEEHSSFRLCTYSAAPVSVQSEDQNIQSYKSFALGALHREFLRADHKLVYPVAPRGLLTCFQGQGCVYFIGINGAADQYLSLRLTLDVPNGIIAPFGKRGETQDIPPRSQKVIAMATGNGKFSSATSLKFAYVSDTIPSSGKTLYSEPDKTVLGAEIELTMNGDLLVASIDHTCVAHRGSDALDTFLWIPQIGQMR